MLQDLGSEGGAATRKLMQNLITCTAQTKLTQLVRAGQCRLVKFALQPLFAMRLQPLIWSSKLPGVLVLLPQCMHACHSHAHCSWRVAWSPVCCTCASLCWQRVVLCI